METKWFYISLAIVFSSVAFAAALGSYFDKPKNKYEAFNKAIHQCKVDYGKLNERQMCMDRVERVYKLTDDNEKNENDSD